MFGTAIFNVASQRNEWLAARQSVIAGNVANANTPGYQSRDVAPFAVSLEAIAARQSAASASGMARARLEASEGAARPGVETLHSGNSVDVADELQRAGEVHKGYALSTGVMRSFSRMLQMTLKG